MSDLAFDPFAVDIGDTVQTDDSTYATAFAVTDVAPETERVKVYSPTLEYTVHRWVDMDQFSVHVPNDDISTDREREAWLNDTLPRARRDRDGDVQQLEYALADDGTVTLRPVAE